MKQKKILIISGQHFITSPRKVDLHFMTDAFVDMGYHVDFITMRLSLVSRYLDDGRWQAVTKKKVNQWTQITESVNEFVWVNWIHPLNLKNPLLNKFTGYFFKHYGKLIPQKILKALPDYELIFIESGLPPLIFNDLKKMAPYAKFIYHCADRLKTIGVHPVVESTLNNTAELYDLVRVVAEDLKSDFISDANVKVLAHGIRKEDFLQTNINPYTTDKNAVSVGDMLFDANAVQSMANHFPEYHFHVFGKKAIIPEASQNITFYGEKPFTTIVPYIQYADIGIAPYRLGSDAAYLCQSSLKMVQYTFVKLPIVAPYFAAGGRAHVCAYSPEDQQSIQQAFQKAIDFDRSIIDTATTLSWHEVCQKLIELVQEKPLHPRKA